MVGAIKYHAMSAATQQLEADIRAGRLRQGMSFQQKCWALTARIPAGSVATYGDIAARLGGRAYRAVGAAMNANPYAPAVPCHRVVGGDGGLTGFAGGLRNKRRMLADEGVGFHGRRVDLARHRVRL